ncbi:hypothetical protein DVH24_010797 [Malus domestica]|uniref:Uncharacterized protein n=1 Tax=Malus domestica TaxID=3750 RepID=A0A498JYB0_MALDO|nr:hypothetical protein DVH24_010797 [Malus domestica]
MENLRSHFVSQLEKVVVGWIWTRKDVTCTAYGIVGLRIWRSGTSCLFPDLQKAGLQITGLWVRSEYFSHEFYVCMKEVEGDVGDDLGMVPYKKNEGGCRGRSGHGSYSLLPPFFI